MTATHLLPYRAEAHGSAAEPPRREELLYRCELTRVYRRLLPDGRSVVCKEIIGPNFQKRFQHEKGILERLSGIPGVVPLAAGDFPSGTIAMEDVGGRALSDRLAEGPLAAGEILELAARLAETIVGLHGAGVAHKNVAPDNILLRGGDGAPCLIDFSLSTTFAEEHPPFVHHSEIAGNLPYLAPEQTGRTGRSLDQRADLYALGAVLYRLAAGRPPFENDDPLQLIHDILATTPPPPQGLGCALPAPFCAIVMRLLEKEPDRRYQSAAGVAHDLRRLLRKGEGEFPLGERDFPLRLTPPSRLIGRERELALLEGALEAALEGAGTAVLVTGGAGVGKTVLVNELRPLVAARRGWFVSGKFDQYGRDPIATATAHALRALGRLLLAEPEGELARQRERLLGTLGENAGLIATALPEFAAVLKTPPKPFPSDPAEAQTRLQEAGLGLLRAVVSPQRPLVMFLDDLQWARQHSIAFLDTVVSDLRLHGFLLVAAYRDDELHGTHPLAAVLPRWRTLGAEAQVLPLNNLPTEGVAQLLEEMLRLERSQAQELARAVEGRTGGNPYDTLEFLNALRNEGILRLGTDGWTWEESAVRRYLGQGDVLELVSQRLATLPAESSEVLQAIACLGGEVREHVLYLIFPVASEVEAGVGGALEDGVLVLEQGGSGREGERLLRFRHDRVQQCLYDRMDHSGRSALHLALARRLALVPHLQFLAAEQYHAAFPQIEDGEDLRRAAPLFWEAAQDARVAGNYPAMERYLAGAAACLEREESLRGEPLLARLETAWHNALYSLGRFEEADRVYASLELACTDPVDLVEATCVQISSLTNRGRHRDGVELGLVLLRRLGFPPAADVEAEMARGVERLYRWMEGGDDEDRRPELKDPVLLAAARVLHHLIAPAFFSDPMLCYQVQLHSQRLWMEHGPCASLLIGFAGAPLVTIALADDFSTGCRAAQRAIAVGEARRYEPQTSWVRHCFALFGSHWVQPLQLTARLAHQAREGLLRGGDLQFACFTYHGSLAALFDCAPLTSFKEELDAALAFATRTGNDFSAPVFIGYRQLWLALIGESGSLGSLEDHSFAEGGYLEGLAAHPLATVKYHIHSALAAAIFGDEAALERHASLAFPLLPYIEGFYKSVLGHFLQALALARRLHGAPEPERAPLVEALAREKGWLAARAAQMPENFLHLQHFIEAEEAWGAGDLEGAALSFDAALLAAEQTQRPWHRALITERAALFHHSRGLTRSSRKLLVEAHYLYDAWGASGKVTQLEENLPFLRGALQERRASDGAPPSVSAATLDLLAVLRASQALSSETSLERLTARLVEILKAITGATAVLLLLRSDEEQGWVLVRRGEPSVLPVAEAGALGLIPLSAFRYVQRTMEPLLVEDAVYDQRFCRDPYLSGGEHCSLMLVPIEKHGTPHALLILENRLSSAVFTRERLDTVKLMAGQLAVSLENARLYEKLEERVAKRTRELQEAQAELVATARQAGMAEIATNVLHNVGNVLNSVNVSAGVVQSALANSKGRGLSRAVQLMKEHAADLGGYLTEDARGQLLPGYLEKLAAALEEEQQGLLGELERLTRSVDHIKEIVSTQQSYAGSSSLVEPVRVEDLLEDALRMNAGALSRHQVTVVRDFAAVPEVTLDRARLLQILVNLISNAKYAMDGVYQAERRLTLSLDTVQGSRLRIRVKDDGEGIAPENLARVFTHGFTTRKGGHGFGLHSCALAAKEMGGTLSATSAGPGLGATFTVELPLEHPGGALNRQADRLERTSPTPAPQETP